jgi:hypothetical protein
MKRKTNLFYNSGPDSKFLTFSNYTEALTGNFLSTNTKLFPSTFLCLNIPSLNKENKQVFINDSLIKYYENKLANLRDRVNEDELFPLSYLIETLMNFDSNTTISYIGNITEQDYLGSYTDTICIIDTQYLQSAIITPIENEETDIREADSTLYGWYDIIDGNEVYSGPSLYSNIVPTFDTELAQYQVTSNYNIEYNVPDTTASNVVFNVVVPLFTFANVNEGVDINDQDETVLTSNFKTNVPLGIWFADDNVNLKVDRNYGQSWSLAIGSQFKPLPTSPEVRSDVYKDPNTDAFKTFAQVLVRQNELLDTIEKQNIVIYELHERISALEQLMTK